MPKVKILVDYGAVENYRVGDVVDITDITALVDAGFVEVADEAAPLALAADPEYGKEAEVAIEPVVAPEPVTEEPEAPVAEPEVEEPEAPVAATTPEEAEE